MSLKKVFGYVRVSTVKQGRQGVSLPEQRDAISRYAARNNFEIVGWFEEMETAAKQGRPVFNCMLKLLRQGKAAGVVLHKIDRGARNLKDWNDISDLIDANFDVFFANENIDMHSRGGRLSADIQAVVAADYVRNLREETKKGFYGRLKQGVYPLPAPIGYLDMGAGKPKEPDPAKAALVRKAFELYGTANHSLKTLGEHLFRLGLRNRAGQRITISALSFMLNNTFYYGLITLKSTGETFEGAHKSIISKSLFDRVQVILQGKTNTRVHKHDFLFRRFMTCAGCGYHLIGEVQKGHHYYRCHTATCPTTGIREEVLEAAMKALIQPLVFSQEERSYFVQKLSSLKADWVCRQEEEQRAMKLRASQLHDRLNRLTDAFIDGTVERELFETRKMALLNEIRAHKENMAKSRESGSQTPQRLAEFLELAGSAWLSYEMGIPEEKRDLLKILTSNRKVDGKNVVVELSFPFSELANRAFVSNSPPQRDIPRIWDRLLETLVRATLAGKIPDLSPFPRRAIDIGRSDPSR